MARLFADEDFDHPIVAELRRLTHDVLTIQEVGEANRMTPDTSVLAMATAQGRAVLTFNRRHFFRLHRTSDDHAGIIICKWHADTIALAGRIHTAIENQPTLARQLIRITRSQR